MHCSICMCAYTYLWTVAILRSKTRMLTTTPFNNAYIKIKYRYIIWATHNCNHFILHLWLINTGAHAQWRRMDTHTRARTHTYAHSSAPSSSLTVVVRNSIDVVALQSIALCWTGFSSKNRPKGWHKTRAKDNSEAPAHSTKDRGSLIPPLSAMPCHNCITWSITHQPNVTCPPPKWRLFAGRLVIIGTYRL